MLYMLERVVHYFHVLSGWFENPKQLIDFLVAVVTLYFLYKGSAMLRSMQDRAHDALFGFYSKLKVYLILLKKTAGEEGSTNYEMTPYYYLAFRTEAANQAADGSASTQMALYGTDKMEEFDLLMKDLHLLFKNADGQIPLNKTIMSDLDFLFEESVLFSKYKKQYPISRDEGLIMDKHKEFLRRIDRLIRNIDFERDRALKKYWAQTNSGRKKGIKEGTLL